MLLNLFRQLQLWHRPPEVAVCPKTLCNHRSMPRIPLAGQRPLQDRRQSFIPGATLPLRQRQHRHLCQRPNVQSLGVLQASLKNCQLSRNREQLPVMGDTHRNKTPLSLHRNYFPKALPLFSLRPPNPTHCLVVPQILTQNSSCELPNPWIRMQTYHSKPMSQRPLSQPPGTRQRLGRPR